MTSPIVADTTARCWSQGDEEGSSAGLKTYSKRRRQQQPHSVDLQKEQEHGAAHSLMELCTSANSSPVKSTHSQKPQGKTPVKMTRKDGKVRAPAQCCYSGCTVPSLMQT